MMERYQPQRWSPASMGAAILVNGGVLAALMFAAPHVGPRPEPTPIEAYPVEADPPPPIPQPLPEPKPSERSFDPPPRADPYLPPRDVAVPIPGPSLATTTELPTAPPPSGLPLGTGTAPAGGVPDTAPPLPVLVAASVDPRYRDAFQPEYPAAERRLERDGIVTVRIRIGADGRVKGVEQVAATSDAFFEATRRQALGRWRFRPAMRDGVAVDSTREMTVRFEMEAVR